jgi:hypothetical protein
MNKRYDTLLVVVSFLMTMAFFGGALYFTGWLAVFYGITALIWSVNLAWASKRYTKHELDRQVGEYKEIMSELQAIASKYDDETPKRPDGPMGFLR